jgi:hypothetical protein
VDYTDDETKTVLAKVRPLGPIGNIQLVRPGLHARVLDVGCGSRTFAT